MKPRILTVDDPADAKARSVLFAREYLAGLIATPGYSRKERDLLAQARDAVNAALRELAR